MVVAYLVLLVKAVIIHHMDLYCVTVLFIILQETRTVRLLETEELLGITERSASLSFPHGHFFHVF